MQQLVMSELRNIAGLPRRTHPQGVPMGDKSLGDLLGKIARRHRCLDFLQHKIAYTQPHMCYSIVSSLLTE